MTSNDKQFQSMATGNMLAYLPSNAQKRTSCRHLPSIRYLAYVN
jgi:hypothetical protein